MCLALVAIDAHPRYRYVVAANRDEFHARPAAPVAWGTEAPFIGILAGRDLTAGGTWLGVTAGGRCAFLTNVREPHRHRASAPTRGELVPRVLGQTREPALALAAVAADGAAYNGFNLLCRDANGAVWVSNRATSPLPVAPGIHGLSNALLNTPWPKLTQTKGRVRAVGGARGCRYPTVIQNARRSHRRGRFGVTRDGRWTRAGTHAVRAVHRQRAVWDALLDSRDDRSGSQRAGDRA